MIVSRNESYERSFGTSVAHEFLPVCRSYCGAVADGMASGAMTVGVGTPAFENEFKITRSTRRFMARPSAVSFDAVG